MSGHFKFAYETPHWTAPIRIALNQKPSQTTACIAQSSSAICAPVGYYAALSGKSVPTFLDNLISLILKGPEIKTDNQERLKLTENRFCVGVGGKLCASSNFLKKHVSKVFSVSAFSQKIT